MRKRFYDFLQRYDLALTNRFNGLAEVEHQLIQPCRKSCHPRCSGFLILRHQCLKLGITNQVGHDQGNEQHVIVNLYDFSLLK